WRPATAGILAVALCTYGSTLLAQQTTAARQANARSQQALAVPGGELIELRVDAPGEVRVGDSYDYRINVVNASDDIVLHNVVIEQRPQQGFQIEKAELLPADRRSASRN